MLISEKKVILQLQSLHWALPKSNKVGVVSGGHSGSSSNMAQSEDWRVAFEEAGSPSSSRSSNSPAQSFRGARGGVRGASPMRRESPIRGASVMNGQAYSTTQYYNNNSEENGDIGSRRTPSRGPPPPPLPSGARVY
jgi:hypothetical protein